MAQMRLATGAAHFCPCHSVRAIRMLGDHAFGHRLVKARPAGAGVKLGVLAEQRLSAAHAGVHPPVFGLVIFPSEGRLRSRLAGDLILLGRELLLPLGFGFLDFLSHVRLMWLAITACSGRFSLSDWRDTHPKLYSIIRWNLYSVE